MALEISNQYLYTGRGPFDAKSLVKTYADLLLENTWLSATGKNSAYNGMIVAVWLNKEDPAKNGVYYLHDSTVTSTFKAPNVTNEANWHKIAEMAELADFTARLTTIGSELSDLSARVAALEEDSDVVTYGYRKVFPEIGEEGKLYVAADEGKSYVWFNGGYLAVSGGGSYEEPDIIYGGSAD